MNIVGNAVKFTRDGEIVVSVAVTDVDGPLATLEFMVRDTGIGISKEFLPDMFAPFTQADGSSTRKYGGTGLGLAVSKELVERFGGTITVESEPQVGSLVRIVIRARLADASA